MRGINVVIPVCTAIRSTSTLATNGALTPSTRPGHATMRIHMQSANLVNLEEVVSR